MDDAAAEGAADEFADERVAQHRLAALVALVLLLPLPLEDVVAPTDVEDTAAVGARAIRETTAMACRMEGVVHRAARHGVRVRAQV